jgi:hypothetical protein
VARVKPVRRLVDAADVNVGRQLVVDPPAQLFRVEPRVQLEMRHLRQRMDAGVRPSGAAQLERLPR